MEMVYDHIIFGAGISGVAKAAELTQNGQSVLLLNKFGFPGGISTESLACLFSREEFSGNSFSVELLQAVSHIRFGVLFENNQFLLLHPEAIKRALWKTLDEKKIIYLFHVIALSVDSGEVNQIYLFGRQGHFTLLGKKLHDFSDMRFPGSLPEGNEGIADLHIHCFVKGEMPLILPGFHFLRRFETPIGSYCSISIKNVPLNETDKVFNAELDRFARHIWKDFGARLLMLPVQPEVIIRKGNEYE
jgi:hypothetical protein